MEQIFLTAAVLLLPMLCTTAGAAGVFLLRKTGEPATRRMLCGMAAGIMLAASVWSLLLPAIERAEQGPLPAWVPCRFTDRRNRGKFDAGGGNAPGGAV